MKVKIAVLSCLRYNRLADLIGEMKPNKIRKLEDDDIKCWGKILNSEILKWAFPHILLICFVLLHM